MINSNVIIGLLIPFVGTSLGATMVLFMRKEIDRKMQKILTGFAAGVMVSASFWSLLIPAVNQATAISGKTGVVWSEGHTKWRVSLNVNKVKIEGGLFEHFEDAVNKRESLEKEYLGYIKP